MKRWYLHSNLRLPCIHSTHSQYLKHRACNLQYEFYHELFRIQFQLFSDPSPEQKGGGGGGSGTRDMLCIIVFWELIVKVF